MENAVRRSFVKSFGDIGSKAALIAHPLGAAMKLADTLRIGDRRHKYTATRFLMGTEVSIAALHLSKDAAQHAVELAFLEIERLSAIFDRHRPGTPVSQLNETGKLSDVSPELYEVMGKAQAYYHLSNGTFDVTVLPVLEMLQKNRDLEGRLKLSQSDFDDALGLVGANSVNVCKNGISFSKSSMAVTLDGIGRGYIVDKASDVLAANGVENHLIIAGGDIRAGGERSPGQPWIVAIEDLSGKGGSTAVIRLKNAAVSTSGGCEFYFDSERAHYHVPNFRNAISSCQGVSLSVVAPTVMEADALSTAAFVMNPKEAISFINSQKHKECLISRSSGAKLHSCNWEAKVGI
ncbi:FAD:protein FMN transferase [Maridesulfovibrio salexigens]|uniref:FAD:protein FMN transferase n=1 Tax=Maridesulfovibrio salexigens (strain ATCC 14822 / DSM 2638 / NCIMB 8403 / VKM B-1763) TaxID=526222 RepID=C6BZT4_MARSD|nr:FAD:protein FMN transferase [Maridesulfovibrio salexigens]ACS78991.1 ApbE family lipoprotein [Maridesulfovibrio salexigens DSM 2638]